MTDKKQIEEIANVLYESDSKRNIVICGIEAVAEDIYKVGYRKQIEGEWIVLGEPAWIDGVKQIPVECSHCTISRYIPNVKKHGYYFCPNCGAHMREGANE